VREQQVALTVLSVVACWAFNVKMNCGGARPTGACSELRGSGTVNGGAKFVDRSRRVRRPCLGRRISIGKVSRERWRASPLKSNCGGTPAITLLGGETSLSIRLISTAIGESTVNEWHLNHLVCTGPGCHGLHISARPASPVADLLVDS